MFTCKNIFLNFKIINFKIKVTLKQKLKFCYQLTQIKHCRYRNVKLLLNIKHSQINKETNKKTKNIKANTSFNVIPCIHSPVIGLFLHISLATMTTFPCTSDIIKKINWIVNRQKIFLWCYAYPKLPRFRNYRSTLSLLTCQ